MKINNKKGQAGTMIEFLLHILYTIILLGILFMFLHTYTTKIDANKLQREIVTGRIIYSDVFSYTDGVRYYPGIIDISKVSDENVRRSITYKNPEEIAAEIVITDNFGNTITHAHLNEAWYRVWSVAAQTKLPGRKSAGMLERKIPITYVHEDRFEPGYMELKVVNPR